MLLNCKAIHKFLLLGDFKKNKRLRKINCFIIHNIKP